MIRVENGVKKYFDRHGTEITEGCSIRYLNGINRNTVCKVYRTEDGELGIDATSPAWIESDRAAPCEYGIYPFGNNETNNVEVVHA